MAAHGSPDVRIYSSVRPLQIQRSFEDAAEVSGAVGSVTREVSIEKHSSVTVTSQSSSSTGMSVNQPSPVNVSPGTVVVKTGSSASPVSPTIPSTVVIRSSAAATGGQAGTPHPQVAGQNVVIIKSSSPAAVESEGPPPQQQVPTQSSVVIRSATTGARIQTIQPSSPNRIIINPSPIAQSRITIGATPSVQAQDEVRVEKNEESITTTQTVVVQGRRSSLTIKAAPSPPPATATATEAHPSAPVADGAAAAIGQHAPPSENPVSEHHPTLSTAPTPTNREDLSEKIRPKKPAGPTFEEILEKFNISSVFIVALAVLLAGVICILGEGEVPLSWILTAVSFFSLASFIALRL